MKLLEPEDFDLVGAVAKGMSRRSGVHWEELQSLGWLGLLDAADRFDPSQGVPFSAYATIRIRGSIKDGLRKDYGRITKSAPGKGALRPVAYGRRLMPQFFGELVMESDIGVEVVDPRPQAAEIVELREGVLRLLERLSPRARKILHHRFWDGLTELEIANQMGVTESRISQIMTKAFERLKGRVEIEVREPLPPAPVEPVEEPLLLL